MKPHSVYAVLAMSRGRNMRKQPVYVATGGLHSFLSLFISLKSSSGSTFGLNPKSQSKLPSNSLDIGIEKISMRFIASWIVIDIVLSVLDC